MREVDTKTPDEGSANVAKTRVAKTRVTWALEQLYAHYDRPEWDGPDDILGTLIATLLSHQTTATSAARAFGQLVDTFEGDWHAVATAKVEAVIEAIAAAGLARQKASRIQAILNQIYSTRGDYSLEFLSEETPEKARVYLCSFRGVGPKTAAYTLMKAARMPLFPMDTHIFRICERLGWLSGRESDADAHRTMEGLIAQDERYSAHVVLVRHGRETCHARRPDCPSCPLVDSCPVGASRTAAGYMDVAHEER